MEREHQNISNNSNKKNNLLSQSVIDFLEKFNMLINKKSKILTDLKEIEQEYNRTLPIHELNQTLESLKYYEQSFEKFKKLAIQSTMFQI